MSLLEARHLTKHFGRVRAVEDVSLSVDRGTTLGIVGESGCGKTTLGRMLIGLLQPTSGTVAFDGRELAALSDHEMRALRKRMQIVFQDPYSALNPRVRIGEAIAEPLEIHHAHLSKPEREKRVRELLARVGLRDEHAARMPSEFSGGQRQRIVIARALAVEPELIVADEPVSALDVSIQAQILNLLADLQRERNLAMVFVSHDLKVIEHVATEVAVMYLGRVVERAPRDQLFAAPKHPYTQALLSAIPDPRPGHRKQRTILEGDVPSPIAIPKGCPFQTRCPLRKTLDEASQKRCTEELPVLRDGSACHFTT